MCWVSPCSREIPRHPCATGFLHLPVFVTQVFRARVHSIRLLKKDKVHGLVPLASVRTANAITCVRFLQLLFCLARIPNHTPVIVIGPFAHHADTNCSTLEQSFSPSVAHNQPSGFNHV